MLSLFCALALPARVRLTQADLFGYSVAMYDNVALLGAPNRDTYYSGVNGGAAFMFDLGFLNVRFSSREYEVMESDGKLDFTLRLCQPSCQVTPGPALSGGTQQQPLQFRTLDGDRFPIYDFTSSDIPPTSWQRSRSPAIGRLDCDVNSYLSVRGPWYLACVVASFEPSPVCGVHVPLQTNCEWISSDSNKRNRSAYDFRAVSDYAPLYLKLELADAAASATPLSIIVTNDQVRARVLAALFTEIRVATTVRPFLFLSPDH
jgi:hypothetical protein